VTRNWQRFYYLIALFDIVAVGTGLYLTHRVTGMLDTAIASTRTSNQRRLTYSELGRLAAEIHAAASNVFSGRDVARSERELDQALATFGGALAATRADVVQSIADPTRRTVLDDLAAVERANIRMTEDARRIFDDFRRNDPVTAAGMLASMSRHYADLNRRLSKLRQDAAAFEDAQLDREQTVAHSFRWYQGILAGALLIIIATSGIYGHRQSSRAHAHHLEREGYIAQLRESEATLERRVLERTEALRKTEERLRLAGRATNDALWDWEIETGTLWWNDAWEMLFGHRTPDPTFALWMSLIHPDDSERVASGLRQFLDSDGSDVWRAEYRLRRGNGADAWVLDRGYLVRGDDRKARRLIGAMMDITERKEAERMKSDFVSFVSHQLRTPLAGMNWMLELAADSHGVPDTTRQYIAEARESGSRLVTLVNDLLDIARLESGRAVAVPERVALDELTRKVLHEMKALIAERCHAVKVQEQRVTHAWVDPQLVRQVITNLLSNAVKYTPPGGQIDIRLQQQNGNVQWSVADSGVGIPRAAQARLFERFYRADNAVAMEVEGTGLGLHLVRLIVEQAGGRVWCESEEGRGAVFSFTLPAASEGAPV
jgi:PAS domain S-box-containing protein